MSTRVRRAVTPAARPTKRLNLLPYLLVAPAMLLVLLIVVYPALYAFQLSLTNANLLRLASMKSVGLANYRNAFSDEILIGSVLRTLRWVATVAGTQLLVALPIALFLNTGFRLRGVVRTSILVPWVVPAAVVAIIWVFMVDANFGVINDILLRLGVIKGYVAWLSEPNAAVGIVSGAMIWAGFPFMAVVLLAALQDIPEDLYEAARVDGATYWQSFQSITIPLLTPTILLVLLLRTIWLSHHVDLIYMMTAGGPGYDNYTVAVYSFLMTYHQLDLGYPSAVAIMLSIVLLGAATVYIYLMERSTRYRG